MREVIDNMFSSTINSGLPQNPNPTGNFTTDVEFKKLYSAIQALQIGIDAVNSGIATYTFTASYGQLVNVYDNAGVSSAQLASASTTPLPALGFCSTFSGVTSGYPGIIKCIGVIQGLSGLTPGAIYYLSDVTPGGFIATKPVGAGKIVQAIGVALDAATLYFNPTLMYTQL